MGLTSETWQAFWPAVVLYFLYTVALVPVGFWIGYRYALKVIMADRSVLRRVYILRAIFLELGAPVGLLTIALSPAQGSLVPNAQYIPMPQSMGWIEPLMFPIVLSMILAGFGALFLSWWIEDREKRRGRWTVRRRNVAPVDTAAAQ